MKDGLSRIKEKASKGFHVCEEKSRDLVSSFMGLFGRDGRIVSHIQLNDRLTHLFFAERILS